MSNLAVIKFKIIAGILMVILKIMLLDTILRG